MRHKMRRYDMGEDVVYAVVERPDLVLLIVNQHELIRRIRRLSRTARRLRPRRVGQRQPCG